MAGQKFTLTFDANLNVSQMKGALGEIQKSLNSLNLPQNVTKGLMGTFQKLSEEIRNFEVAANKDITGKADFSKLEKSADRINSLFERLKIQIKDLKGLSGKDLEKLFPENISKNIQNANKAFATYSSTVKTATSDLNKAEKAVQKLNDQIAKEKSKNVLTSDQFKGLKDSIKTAENDLTNYTTHLEELKQKQADMEANLNQPMKSSKYRTLIKEVEDTEKEIRRLQGELDNLTKKQANSTTNSQHAKDLADLNTKYTEAIAKLTEYQNKLKDIQSTQTGGGLQKLIEEVGRLTGLDMSKFSQDVQGVSQAIQTYLNQQLQQLGSNLNNAESSINNFGQASRRNAEDVRAAGDALRQFNTQSREIDMLRSRIQYFFGLNNAIQLVRRTMRAAYETIKDLDKAMTATAVVTDFSVGDMWSQLPEYTKRANELGVTTQAAYEAATLYYQQGLNTNEVMAMSNETLKMARIAGLDAAEATDRMTNAIRGFNMEINTTNAQRIDDVYSRLAAISASNVDEISTAMTKVASLASNANMEFETTAAFLAQIIETTRESAETAGTALKTVVARFSEVKKLVDEGALKGQDDEGEVIDVNKVSAALRTAGIDLNKYFLGEVGLDDIFMELASKWDSLTTLQQRYIATQAAGSRQQSRFIALMSDYARTQELVGEAYKANGASAKQFAKTQESLESKLARLKNAWNEFAMGILNSDLVKAGVDLLTNLLNGVNALTSGFGTLNSGVGSFISTFAKLALLIGGLNIGRGLVNGLFGSTLATITGQAAAGTFQQIAATAMLGNNAGRMAGRGLLPTLGAGFINPFMGIGTGIGKAGKAIWGGAQNLGAFLGVGTNKAALAASGGMSWLAGGAGASGAAAGLAGLGVGLVAIAGVVGLAYGAYQLWLNFSPEGKLKKAKKAAEDAAKALQEAEDKQKSISSFQETYDEQTEKVNTATTVEETKQAYSDRNEAILNAMKENPDLAQYVNSEIIGGELVLTVDASGVQEAAVEAAKEATKAAMNSYYADAGVAWQQAQNLLDTKIIYGASMVGSPDQQTTTERVLGTMLPPVTRTAGPTLEEQQQSVVQSKIAEKYVQLALQTGLDSFDVYSDEFVNSLSSALASLYVIDADSIKSILENDEGKLDLGKILNISEQLYSNGNLDQFSLVLSAINGDYFNNMPLTGLYSDPDKLETYFPTLYSQIEVFADTLGIGTDKIEQAIKNQLVTIKKIRIDFLDNLRSTYGFSSQSYSRAADKSYSYLQSTVPILEQAQPTLNYEQMQNLIEHLYGGEDLSSEELSETLTFLSSVNLDTPINAFQNLTQAAKSSNEYIKGLAESILESNSQLQNSGYLVQSFLMSGSYDEILEEIEKIIETNGELGATDIEELAKKCGDLDILLKNNIVGAKGLAKALTLIASGKIQIEDLNSSVLNIYENIYNFKTLVQDVQRTIQNFDAGTDMGEGVDFLAEKTKELQELINNFEFGNERTKNLYELLFGSGSYMTDWQQGEDIVRQNVEQMSSWLENDALGFFSDDAIAKALGITQLADGLLNWDLSNYDGYSDLISAVQDAGFDELGIHLSEEAAKMFIEAYRAHGKVDTEEAFQLLDLKDLVKSVVEQYGTDGGVELTESEIAALAASVGKSRDELVRQINNYLAANGGGELTTVEDRYKANIAAEVGKIELEAGPEATAEAREQIQQIFDDAIENGTIDLSKLNEIITKNNLPDGALDSIIEQYNQYLDRAGKTGSLLTIDGKVISITGDENDDLVTILTNSIQNASDQGVNILTSGMSQVDASALQEAVYTALRNAGTSGARSISASINGIRPILTIPHHAAGGYISKSETSLTGEEGSEIVWNKEKGYSYIAGANGPEFNQLNPGDRVFNAEETKKILHNSKSNSTKFLSNANAEWGSGDSDSDGGSGSGSGEDKAKEDKWKNEIDWLYNLVEDIAELERTQVKLQEEYDDYLKDDSKGGQDLYNLLIKQLGNLYTQLDNQTYALEQREREMREFMDANSQYSDYFSYNWSDRTIEIDWDKIEALQDKDTYNEIKDLISQAEEIQSKMDDSEDSIQDLHNQIEELENIWREVYVDFEKRVLDALVKSYQDVIDNYSELNDTLNESNSQILNALQKQISLERQIRDNTQTEQDIADQEAQLAFLRRDTTGGNDLAALQLGAQLDESRQSYEDELIDQAISKLQEDNDAATQQREKQIEIMQAQLDYQQQSGEFNARVRELLENAMGADGKLLTDSELVQLLKNAENWNGMSDTSKKIWEDELNTTYKQVAGFILKENAQENGTYITALTAAIGGISSTIGSYSQALTKLGSGNSSGGSSSGGSSSGGKTPSGSTSEYGLQTYGSGGYTVTKDGKPIATKYQGGSYSQVLADLKKLRGYATGGLSTKTGPAWLDGTPSEPEYVLNARQTDAFLKLADVLPELMSGGSTSTTTFGGINLNLVMNVDQIASDYDVDRIADRVKSIIYDAGSYRNVNTLNFSR